MIRCIFQSGRCTFDSSSLPEAVTVQQLYGKSSLNSRRHRALSRTWPCAELSPPRSTAGILMFPQSRVAAAVLGILSCRVDVTTI